MFAPGTFVPSPGSVPVTRAIATLSWLEFKLFVRNGEQLAVNLVIPVSVLLSLILLPIGDLGPDRPGVIVPTVLAGAIISSAFTGLSIAVGFDRRYGALKRVGATIAPRWAIIASKSIAVTGVAAAQLTILTAVAAAVGWAPTVEHLFGVGLAAIVGSMCFAAFGLLLGGSLRAEIILPLANILWLFQLGLCALAALPPATQGPLTDLVRLSPPGALVLGLKTTHGAEWQLSLLVLMVWGAVAAWLARKTFRFT